MQVRVTFEIGVFEPDGADEATLDDLARSAAEDLVPEVSRQFPGTRLVEVGRERRYFKSIERPVPANKSPDEVPF